MILGTLSASETPPKVRRSIVLDAVEDAEAIKVLSFFGLPPFN